MAFERGLTVRERQCLVLACFGMSFKRIAWLLQLSPKTVKYHLDGVRKKLDVVNLPQAAALVASWSKMSI